MTKKVLILSTSPRNNGNSQKLAESFYQGAKQANHDVELIQIYDQQIGFCKGCLSCQKVGKCIIQDDANAIVEKMYGAEVIVFATPIYFYEMCGQMKTLLDRSNPLFPKDYVFKDIYLLASAAEEEASAADIALKGLSGWVSCFDQAKLVNSLLAYGVTNIHDIEHTAFLNQAYEMGMKV